MTDRMVHHVCLDHCITKDCKATHEQTKKTCNICNFEINELNELKLENVYLKAQNTYLTQAIANIVGTDTKCEWESINHFMFDNLDAKSYVHFVDIAKYPNLYLK